MVVATIPASPAKTLPGDPYPLDASFDGRGTNFSVFSEVAERAQLCLFGDDGREARVNLEERDGYNWHGYLNGVGPGQQQYGYRVHGPWDPQRGILLLSQGVPMLLGGDEIGRTQRGNNNAYCQDNELTWFDWEHADKNLLEFTIRLIHLRRDHPVFHRRGWYQGRSIRGSAKLDDIGWFRPDGSGMSADDWQQGYVKSLQIFLNGGLGYVDRRGEPVRDDDFLVLVNAHHEDVFFQPALSQEERPWQIVVNTSKRIENGEEGEKQSNHLRVKTKGRSVIVLTRPCNPCGRPGPLGI